MNNQLAYQRYQQVQVETANQGQLLIMLLQGCIKFLRIAVRNIEEKDLVEAHNHIIKAQNIIFELMNTLDREQGGQIAENLYALYDFMITQLLQANVKKDPELIEVVEDLMTDLLHTWQQIIKS